LIHVQQLKKEKSERIVVLPLHRCTHH